MAFIITFFALFVIEPIFFALLRLFGFYVVVGEQEARVFVLFGKVVGVIDQPGVQFPILSLGLRGLFVNLVGQCHVVDTRIDQQYLRSQPVNSEEGAPMGIGIWYEMRVSDPVSFLFKNTDPQGSLRANVSSATIRCLSNLPLEEMLESRHHMSSTVRAEVSPQSASWGYMLGSVYIRKVHFRDHNMIRQIEEKVTNRLKQVTSAIRQDGTNRVNVISGSAEKEAAAEFARAAAIRPQIVGESLRAISRDQEVAEALFEVLEVKRIADSHAELTLLPAHRDMFTDVLSARLAGTPAPEAPKPQPVPEREHTRGRSAGSELFGDGDRRSR